MGGSSRNGAADLDRFDLVKGRTTSLEAELLEGTHKFELTETDVSNIFCSPVYREVIASAAFQRLKKIHFLGSLDYIVDPAGPKPSKRHTRYQHSLGVARLALQFARDRGLSKRDEELSVVAALLHDIGHAPLSHSLESVFKREFGVSHHVIGERIVKGDAQIGTGLYRALRKWNVNPFEVLAIVDGKGSGAHRELFNYSINVDTIEAIIRSSTYIFPRRLCWPPSTVLTAFMARDGGATEILDNFWTLKADVYSLLIQSRTGVFADYVCQRYMKDSLSDFEREDYYFTEADLEKKHPELFRMLGRISSQTMRGHPYDAPNIPFVRRRFWIDKQVDLDSVYSIDNRYLQEKTDDCYRS